MKSNQTPGPVFNTFEARGFHKATVPPENVSDTISIHLQESQDDLCGAALMHSES